MSKLETYKFTILKRPSIVSKSQIFDSQQESQVLRPKIDNYNRIHQNNSSSLIKQTSKIYTESQYNNTIKFYQSRISFIKESEEVQRKTVRNRYQELLSQIVDLLSFVCKNSSVALEYVNSQKTNLVSANRDHEMEYRLLRDKLEQIKNNKGMSCVASISQLKKSIINPENSKERIRTLTFVKMADLKIGSNKKDICLSFSHHSCPKPAVKSSPQTPHKNKSRNHLQDHENIHHGSGDKTKHYQQKAKKLEEALNKEIEIKVQNQKLIHSLNDKIYADQLQFLNLKMKSRFASYY